MALSPLLQKFSWCGLTTCEIQVLACFLKKFLKAWRGKVYILPLVRISNSDLVFIGQLLEITQGKIETDKNLFRLPRLFMKS